MTSRRRSSPARRPVAWRRWSSRSAVCSAACGVASLQHAMPFAPPGRHLLRAKDLADAPYSDPLTADDRAARAGLSKAHFSREFKVAFGESPHAYLLTRRLERASALL